MKNLISKTTWSCAVMSMIVLSAGLILYADGKGQDVLWFGILILILTPFFGVLASMISFAYQKERKWMMISAVLMSVIIIGVLVSILI